MTTIIQHLQLQLLQQQQAIDQMHERLRSLDGSPIPSLSMDALSETEEEVNQRYERISEVLMGLIDQAQTALEPGFERSRISSMFSPSNSPSPGPSRPLSRKCSCLLNGNSGVRQLEIPYIVPSPILSSRYRDQSTQTDFPYTPNRRYSDCQSYSVSSCESVFSDEEEDDERLFRNRRERWVNRRKSHHEPYSSEAEPSEEELHELPSPRKRSARNSKFDRDLVRLFTNLLSWESALCTPQRLQGPIRRNSANISRSGNGNTTAI
ncbi:hypothetical protein K493DRAFT_333741 [Basidiobolus meristosporus CBS 931.73]|uniref:Uncharacterized protein n=1 Tax=Basidiobolus meristosporus CBS 931.73 TaxID=1314790 RepID=A0A1Y1Z3U7_9FUNG|nr:hypothetical protein K493DRAFT_333741 [Basidiobolus meristosporus CBS 931.73]|eukprot:ORY04919.1 hypothetical protein K493DRAFT_333741 [Basidiobolus meristosporus CBS 931.73]